MNGLVRSFRKIGGAVIRHSPIILTGMSGAGLITTVIFAIKDSRKADLIVDQIREESDGEPDKIELLKAVVPVYIPTIVMGTATMACMIGATSINLKRNAVLASLYSATDAAMHRYQEKVCEVIGERKEKEVRDKVAESHVREHPFVDKEVIVTGNGDYLCFDVWSGRYFRSNIDAIKRVQNEINSRIINDMWVTLNEVYFELGLEDIRSGNSVGWNTDDLLKFEFSWTGAENGEPCLVLDYEVEPRNYRGF